MMTRRKQAIAAALIFGLAGPANAATFDFDFGTLFSNSGPTSTTSFAHLSVTTTDYKVFDYDLKVGGNLNAIFGSTGTFVSSLLVNTASNADPIWSGIDSGTWGVSKVALNTNPNNAGSVSWDFGESFCGSGNACNPNNAMSRLSQGEEVKWTTTFQTAQNPLFGSPALLLKVQGFGSSAEYVPMAPIPEPEIYAMFLAGLGFLGFHARRRKLRVAAAA